MNYSEMEQELRSLQERTKSLQTQIKAIFWVAPLILAAFALVLSVIQGGIGTFQSDIGKKVLTAETQYKTAAEQLHTDFRNQEWRLFQRQSLSLANAFIKDADMRQNTLDLEGALRSAIVAFDKLREVDSPNWAAALDRMDTAIKRATMGQKHLPELLLLEVDKAVGTVEKAGRTPAELTGKLKETLKLHRAQPGP